MAVPHRNRSCSTDRRVQRSVKSVSRRPAQCKVPPLPLLIQMGNSQTVGESDDAQSNPAATKGLIVSAHLRRFSGARRFNPTIAPPYGRLARQQRLPRTESSVATAQTSGTSPSDLCRFGSSPRRSCEFPSEVAVQREVVGYIEACGSDRQMANSTRAAEGFPQRHRTAVNGRQQN